jgi:TRAP-type C4-dicarboxylate transport system permease large subunit
MIIKIMIVFLFIAIIYCLGSAVFFMVRYKGRSSNTVKALTWRISLSLLLFFLLIIGYMMGWISPRHISLFNNLATLNDKF